MAKKPKKTATKEKTKVSAVKVTAKSLPAKGIVLKSAPVETAPAVKKDIQPPQMTTKQHFYSNEILIEGERASDLVDLRDSIIRELKPKGEIESILVDKIVSNIWRSKRCMKLETQIMEYLISSIQEFERGFFTSKTRTKKEVKQLRALKLADQKSGLGELARYETALEQQIYSSLDTLYKLRQKA
ncbi:MAG: hypothetical protein MRJ65_07960 [Candidatus Brocadiaceae bacterium]|nr:hypothetical protein [Candidatus Brocadiaceae bacterium]